MEAAVQCDLNVVQMPGCRKMRLILSDVPLITIGKQLQKVFENASVKLHTK